MLGRVAVKLKPVTADKELSTFPTGDLKGYLGWAEVR